MWAFFLVSLLMACLVEVSDAASTQVERWLHDATSPVLQVRLQALRALGESGDVRAVPPLLTALRDNNATIRDCAIAALRSLVQALQGAYATVVQWIEELLATLDGSTAAPPPAIEKTWHLRYL